MEQTREILDKKRHNQTRTKRAVISSKKDSFSRGEGRLRRKKPKAVRVYEYQGHEFVGVIAGNYDQYRQWLQENKLPILLYRYLHGIMDLEVFARNSTVLLVGDYTANPIIQAAIVKAQRIAEMRNLQVHKANWVGYKPVF